MRSIAIYSLKGGVGKTTLAANLAWASATLSSRWTLLWDLDPQSAASFLLGADEPGRNRAKAVFARDVDPARLILATPFDRLDLLPADASLRGLDQLLFGLAQKRKLARMIARLGEYYERILLDVPPGLTETSEQALRAADLIVVPVIPSPLSQRAFDDVVAHLDRGRGRRPAILPVYNMVDRRRRLHRAALEAQPNWPAIPMASAFEAMSADPDALGRLRSGSPAGAALESLWRGIERKLSRLQKT